MQHCVLTFECSMMSHCVEASQVERGKVTKQELTEESYVDNDDDLFFAGGLIVLESFRVGALSTLLWLSILDGRIPTISK